MNTKKIVYFDGLRGLAAFIVFISHSVLTFYPSAAFGTASIIHHKTEVFLSGTPLNVLWNGNFSVCIFFVLSGFVLSHKFFETKNYNFLISSAIRRYFRLSIPVCVSILIAYLFLKFNFFYNKEASLITGSNNWLQIFYNFIPSGKAALFQGLYGTFILGDASYNINLWTMKMEFMGSFLVFSFCALMGMLRNRWVIYLVSFFLVWDTYYLGFISGVLLSDVSVNYKCFIEKLKKNNFTQYTVFILLISAILLGSYPLREMPGMPGETMYALLKFKWLKVNNIDYYAFYHLVASVCIILWLILYEPAQRFFSSRPLQYLGRISFSLYLIHFIILCSFTSKLIIVCSQYLSYDLLCLTAFTLTLILTLAISHLYSKYIDEKAIIVSKKIYNNFFSQK
jgi:Predicted acyltransferases